ncbi:MAG TPA: EAL domain-containing protein [Candidatus Limnocylindrales bacterium]|nr:EAL domain-containing protein [Candidatus Limnocylindrales bacterium]
MTQPGNVIRAVRRRFAATAARVRQVTGRRSVFVVGAGILLLALGAGAVTVVEVSEQTAREADVRLQRHAEAVSQDVATLFANASRDVRLARRNATYDSVLSDTWTAVTPTEQATVDAGLTYVGNRYAVDEICLIRSTGAEVARWNGGSVAPPSQLSSDERGNPFFGPAMTLADDEVFVTQPYVSPDSHRWVYGFATPVVLPSGARTGVLHFEIPLERLARLVAEDPFGSDGTTMVLDRQGNVVVGPASGLFPAMAGAAAPLPTIAQAASADWRGALGQAVTSDQATAASVSDAGGPTKLASTTVPGTDLVVVATASYATLYADVDRSRLNLAATVGPLLLVLVALSLWFSRRLAGANGRLRVAGIASGHLASIVESADDAIIGVEPDGRIATWNGAAAATYGRDRAAMTGQRLDVLFAAGHADDLPILLDAVVNGERVERFETVHQRHDGSTMDVWVTLSPVRDPAGVVVGASVITRDISDRKRLEGELAHQALHDALTGLPNRVLFEDRLRQSLQALPRDMAVGNHAVLFVDLDDFKVINDTLGHPSGDELLVAVAGRLQSAVRGSDTAARLGGDEFTILLENVVSESQAIAAADRVLGALRQPFELAGHQVVVSASIGIAFGSAGRDRPEDLLRSADTALYEAKAHGKGRHETYHQAMNVRAWRRLEVEHELRVALARGELTVHYQSILELQTGELVAIEALARWQHPRRGLVSPADFIPVAEQTGLIVSLGAHVRATALDDLAELRRLPGSEGLAASINVSPRELVQPGFADAVAAELAARDLPPAALRLEITEGAMVEGEAAVQAVRALRAHGIRISIDDFGTGYSSLGYFRDLEIDGLKIDRAFVDGVGREREDTAIVTAAIAFGHALDVDVTGEGIETDAQRDALLALGCRYGQGFLFARPVPKAELIADIDRRRKRHVA